MLLRLTDTGVRGGETEHSAVCASVGSWALFRTLGKTPPGSCGVHTHSLLSSRSLTGSPPSSEEKLVLSPFLHLFQQKSVVRILF